MNTTFLSANTQTQTAQSPSAASKLAFPRPRFNGRSTATGYLPGVRSVRQSVLSADYSITTPSRTPQVTPSQAAVALSWGLTETVQCANESYGTPEQIRFEGLFLATMLLSTLAGLLLS